MRLSVHLGPWDAGTDHRDQLALAQEAERLGFDAVWASEAYGSDAVSVLAWLAARTTRIRLGSAILQMPARSPAMTAMTAATLDQLSGGRFVLGLGPSGPQVAEGWHGQRFGRQLQRTREYVAVVRMALARERVELQGETLTLPLPDGPGRALRLTIAPAQERVPIYLAGIGPRSVALAGEIADGWIPILVSPEGLADLRGDLEEGATRAGRSLEGFDVAPWVHARVDDDLERARDALRAHVALYVGGMGSRERNFYNDLVRRLGFPDAAREVQDLYLAGRREEAGAALPGELIDAVTLCGPGERVRERLRAFAAAGAMSLGVTPVADGLAGRLEQLRALAALA
jgi:F420-dependent oxidoreductase-like protein